MILWQNSSFYKKPSKPRNRFHIKTTFAKRLHNTQRIQPLTFWVLVALVWAAGQVPILGMPFLFLSTWVHELGHGLGAIMTGGHFAHMRLWRIQALTEISRQVLLC